jgi:predicted metal-dependent peptidase
MAVDAGWRLYYSKEFVLSESPEALATVLLHESMHCLMSHSQRFAALDQISGNPLIWNIAGDCSINEILDESNMVWTEKVTPVRFSNYIEQGLEPGMLTETSYFKLLKWSKENKSGWQYQDCGSILDNKSRPYEIPKDDKNTPSVKKDQQDIVRDRVAGDILQASKNRGNISAGLLRWAESYLEPRLDWKRILGTKLRKAVATIAGRRDYSFVRPSRRQSAMKQMGSSIVLPAMRQPAPPRVAIVVDTSGSISENDLKQMIGEVFGIVKAVGVSSGINVIACDAKAFPAQKLRSTNSINSLKLQGGGGTDMGEGIKAALEIKPIPQIVVVLTDGYTPWPDAKPRNCDTFITVLTQKTTKENVPSWIQTVVIE